MEDVFPNCHILQYPKRYGPGTGHKSHAALNSKSSSTIYLHKPIISITPQVPC